MTPAKGPTKVFRPPTSEIDRKLMAAAKAPIGPAVPQLPGAVGVSHLKVYDSMAADGIRGGTPHVHSLCTEAYYVIKGYGSVMTLSMAGGAQETPLVEGALVWFPPGTIHRLVNKSGDLEILVIMANAGLPEAGDMVLTFPEAVLSDHDRYWGEALLSTQESTTLGSGQEVRARRDLAVGGFLDLWEAWHAGDVTALASFFHHVVALLGPRADEWRTLIEEGPVAAVDATVAQLDALSNGAVYGLLQGGAHRLDPPKGPRRMGCCGTLGTYVDRLG